MSKQIFLLLMTMILTAPISAQTPPAIEPGVSQTLARWRAARYSNVRYKLNLTVEKQSPVLKGSIEIRVVLSEPGAIATGLNSAQNPVATAPGSDVPIILDWRKIRGKEQFATVSNAIVNDQPAKFAEQNEHLIFTENVRAGENVIKLDFTSPIATSGAAVTRYVDKEDNAEYIYSLFVPSDASTAFPCFDQPDLKARFKLTLVAPLEWEAISNTRPRITDGIIEEHHIIGNKKDHNFETVSYNEFDFPETQPISTYVFAFAAGDFAEMSEPGAIATGLNSTERAADANPVAIAPGSDLRATADGKIYVRKSQAEKFKPHAAEVFRLNREAVKYLEGYFDFKFPFPKYDLVLLPEFPFGGMEHAGATFLREDRVIFPSEPTANDYITRGNLIFHEAAHQWFGDTVTMRWFDDLWLKEGFAEFMAYKTMEKVLPQYNAWKAFYERNKPLAYQTDSTRGTTAIYQEIPNLSAAKSAYGNIVYRKAPSFLRQAEFYLGADKFQSAARAFLKQNAFKNAEWQDLIKSFEAASGKDLKVWAETWVEQRGLPTIRIYRISDNSDITFGYKIIQENQLNEKESWNETFNILQAFENGQQSIEETSIHQNEISKSTGNSTIDKILIRQRNVFSLERSHENRKTNFIFPNYQDYGYGIFLLDERSRNYILANIQNEKDDFLRAMMWGALWDSVREAELAPGEYVELAIKNIAAEKDELTISTILNRVATAMNYYVENDAAAGERATSEPRTIVSGSRTREKSAFNQTTNPVAIAPGSDIAARLERVLLDRMKTAETLGQRVTFYRAFLNLASTDAGKNALKDVLNGKLEIKGLQLKTKDKFDIAARLLVLGDKDARQILDDLVKTETSDEAKRYAYAARAGVATTENKQQFFADFIGNKEISESYIESAVTAFNSARQADLTLPFLEKSLQELPNLKRTRKIFFVNAWLAAFVGGQKSEKALAVVNKFLADNPDLDRDLRLKILENLDVIERSVKIRRRFAN